MSTEIQRTNPTGEPQSGNHDLMHLIQRGYEVAIEKGAAIEVVQSILTEMRLQRDREERATFQAALRRIQDNLKEIRKRGRNDDTHSDYVKEIDIDREINQQLQTEGMTLSFEPRVSERPEMVLIVGLLSLGAYTREYPLEMPADGKGPKGGGVMSRTHATGSAITYAKRYLKGMIFNLSYAGKDDAGQSRVTFRPAHDQQAIFDAISSRSRAKPFLLVAKSIKGKGVSYMENNPIWHYRSPNQEEYAQALLELKD